jgi:hypothetical protein
VGRRDYATALAVLTKAVAAGSTSYLAYHNLAISRLPELTQPWMPNPAIDPQALAAAAADFRTAIRLSPSHVASYEGLAGVIRGLPTYLPADLELLARGLAQSPGNTMIEAGIAAAELRDGRVADGRARLERLCARHPNTKSAGINFARRLLASELVQAEIAEINRLSAQAQWADVRAVADGALARDLEPSPRQFMENVRVRTAAYEKLESAAELANQADFAGASETLEALLASEPEIAVAKDARRLLREISLDGERAGSRH